MPECRCNKPGHHPPPPGADYAQSCRGSRQGYPRFSRKRDASRCSASGRGRANAKAARRSTRCVPPGETRLTPVDALRARRRQPLWSHESTRLRSSGLVPPACLCCAAGTWQLHLANSRRAGRELGAHPLKGFQDFTVANLDAFGEATVEYAVYRCARRKADQARGMWQARAFAVEMEIDAATGINDRLVSR